MFKYGRGRTNLIRLADGAAIPLDPDNTDYRAAQAWIAAGNTPADPDADAPRRPSPVQWFDRVSDATQDAIIAASLTNPNVQKLLIRCNGHTEGIDTSDSKTIAGVNYLRAQGLLTPAEKAALLA